MPRGLIRRYASRRPIATVETPDPVAVWAGGSTPSLLALARGIVYGGYPTTHKVLPPGYGFRESSGEVTGVGEVGGVDACCVDFSVGRRDFCGRREAGGSNLIPTSAVGSFVVYVCVGDPPGDRIIPLVSPNRKTDLHQVCDQAM